MQHSEFEFHHFVLDLDIDAIHVLSIVRQIVYHVEPVPRVYVVGPINSQTVESRALRMGISGPNKGTPFFGWTIKWTKYEVSPDLIFLEPIFIFKIKY